MALLSDRHCGRPEPHEPHQGRETTYMGGHPVVCHGDPKRLVDQQWAEANPPPGPPDIPRWYDWDVSQADHNCPECTNPPPHRRIDASANHPPLMQCVCGATWWTIAPVDSPVPTELGEGSDETVIKAAADAAEHAYEFTPYAEMAEHAWPNAIRAAWPIIAAYLASSGS